MPYEVTIQRVQQKMIRFGDKEHKLTFPDKCAYCGSNSNLKKITLEHSDIPGLSGKVPYCKQHFRTIKLNSFVNTIAIIIGIMSALVLGIIMHEAQVLAIDGIGFNYIAAIIIGIIISVGASFILKSLISKDKAGVLDENGAVSVGTVYKDAYTLVFINSDYCNEFITFNKDYLI
jgi:hypothetical protein